MSATESTTEQTMTNPIADLTGFQRDLLYIIAGYEKPSGQQVLETIDDYYPENITHGRVYPNLDTLKNKGLIDKGELDRRTNYYDINSDGIEALEERNEWEEMVSGE